MRGRLVSPPRPSASPGSVRDGSGDSCIVVRIQNDFSHSVQDFFLVFGERPAPYEYYFLHQGTVLKLNLFCDYNGGRSNLSPLRFLSSSS